MEKYEEKELLFRYCMSDDYVENGSIAIGSKIYQPKEIKKAREQYLKKSYNQTKEYIHYKNILNEFESLQKLYAYRDDPAKTLLLLDNDSHIRELLQCFSNYLNTYQNNIYITQDKYYQWIQRVLNLGVKEQKLQLFVEYISEGNIFVSLELFCKLHQISPATFRGYINGLKTQHPELYEKYQRIENDKNQKLTRWVEEIVTTLDQYQQEHEQVDIIDYYQLFPYPHQLVYKTCGICKKIEYISILNQFGIYSAKDVEGTPEEWTSAVVEINGVTFTPEEQLEILDEYVSMNCQNCPDVLMTGLRRKSRQRQKRKQL